MRLKTITITIEGKPGEDFSEDEVGFIGDATHNLDCGALLLAQIAQFKPDLAERLVITDQ